MDQNRRRYSRKAPDKFAFVQIERDEVGKVLNVSEGGLSFSSFAPISQNGPLYFWFSFNLKDRIEAMGEIVWTDITRKIGGLRFTRLSQASREQIRAWMSRMPALPEQPVEELVPELAAAGGPARIRTSEPDRVAKFVSKARVQYSSVAVDTRERNEQHSVSTSLEAPSFEAATLLGSALQASRLEAASLQTPSLQTSTAVQAPNFESPSFEAPSLQTPTLHTPSFEAVSKPISDQPGSLTLNLNGPSPSLSSPNEVSSPTPVMERLAGLVPLERYLSAKKQQLLLGVFLGAGITAAAIMAVQYAASRRHAENTGVVSAAAVAPKKDVQTLPLSPQPESKPNVPTIDVFSGGQQSNWTVPKSNAGKRVTASYASASSPLQPSPSKAANRSEQTSGPPQGSEVPSANKKQTTPSQLWASVQTGNSKAAVELAEYYIRGDGVPQNCQQARVLLLMASEKRNSAAIKRLQELDKDKATCP